MKVYASQKYVDDAIAESKAYIDGMVAAIPVASWDNLENRPFGEEGLMPITWDGVVGDRVTATLSGASSGTVYVKVSNSVLSVEDCNGATLVFNDGESYTVTSENNDIVETSGGISLYEASVLAISDPESFSATLSGNFTESGIYFMMQNDYHTASITFPLSIKTLDEKFIPDTIVRTSDLESIVTKEELENGTMTEFVLKSSTPDSTKLFKIAVDDNGTITATEITE